MLGPLEFAVLSAVMHHPDHAYGAKLREIISQLQGSPVSHGAVHTALVRLEKKKLLRSWYARPPAEERKRGGRARRMFAATDAGHVAVHDFAAFVERCANDGITVKTPGGDPRVRRQVGISRRRAKSGDAE